MLPSVVGVQLHHMILENVADQTADRPTISRGLAFKLPTQLGWQPQDSLFLSVRRCTVRSDGVRRRAWREDLNALHQAPRMARYRTSIDDPKAGSRWLRKTCAQCGNSFLSRGKAPTYCSERCARIASNARRQHQKRSACLVCGAALNPQRASRKYCCGACRQRACRERVFNERR